MPGQTKKLSLSAQAGKAPSQKDTPAKRKTLKSYEKAAQTAKPPVPKQKRETTSRKSTTYTSPKTSAQTGRSTRQSTSKTPHSKLKVMLLGGVGEIGKNMTVLEYEEDIVVIDCGLAFPDDDLLGIDLVIPDITYLVENVDRVRAILLTHGHEDHIGAIPYILKQIDVPVYGTRLTLGILDYKLKEAKLPYLPTLHTINAGDTVNLGCFKAEFIHVNHSIADACAIAIKTPVGMVFHTGDFKLDVSPMDGQMMDLVRIGQIGERGVLLLLGESTNAERVGYTPSERTVGFSLDHIFLTNQDKRIVIATFSSNVHRVQQIINTSIKYGRKVAVLGRSMVNVLGAAMELGYMTLPEGTLIESSEIRRYKPEQVTLITTGSQGEPMSALYRLAFGEHDRVKLTHSDLVVLSASAIPGNEKLVGKIINALIKSGVKVVSDQLADVHVSGHACSEELKLMHALLKPTYFIPIHGESRHLYAHKEIAEFMGMPSDHIFLPELGQVIEFDRKSAKHAGTVPAGRVLVDGTGVGDVGSVVLRDRKMLGEDGLIVVVAAVSDEYRCLMSGPDIISRGYVYMKESEDLLDKARYVAAGVIDDFLSQKKHIDYAQMKNRVREELSKFFFAANKRSPMILPLILNV